MRRFGASPSRAITEIRLNRLEGYCYVEPVEYTAVAILEKTNPVKWESIGSPSYRVAVGQLLLYPIRRKASGERCHVALRYPQHDLCFMRIEVRYPDDAERY